MENQENKIIEEVNNGEVEATEQATAVNEKKPSLLGKLVSFAKADKKRVIIILCAVVAIIVVGVIIISSLDSSSDYNDTGDDYDYSYYSSQTPTYSYNLPTVEELVNTFKETFTVSDLKQEASKTMFKVSTGETIMGFADDSGKVTTFNVHTTGSDIETLLKTTYHFYPMCHFLTEITGATVTVDALIDIYSSVDPVHEDGSVSSKASWKTVKDGIEYEMIITEYSSYNYLSMDLYARIK